MKLSSIRLHNFRPYHGDQTLDLTPAENNTLIVIYGENTMGKTSLFIAIYWCLYETALDRNSNPIPVFAPLDDGTEQLLNLKAAEDGDYETSVELVFEHDGKTWTLTRKASCDGDPYKADEFETTVLLKIDNEPIEASQIRNKINDVIHQDAAQFFLFDGELLSRYETWLDDTERYGDRVKSAVERTVGIAALTIDEPLGVLCKTFENDVLKAGKKDQRTKKDSDAVEVCKAAIRDAQSYKDGSVKSLQSAQEESGRIEEQHDSLQKWQAAQNEINALEENSSAEKLKEDQANDALRDLVKKHFAMGLGSQASELVERLHSQINDTIAAAPHLVQESITAGDCAICNQAIDDKAHDHLQETLDNTSDPLTDLSSLRKAFDRLRWAARFAGESHAQSHAETLEQDALRARLEKRGADDRAKELRAAHPVKGNYADQMQRLTKLSGDIEGLRRDIAECEEGIEREELEKKRLEDKIRRAGSADPALNRRSDAANLAKNAFTKALEIFAEGARADIARSATAVAEDLLASKENYAAITVSEDYKVAPVDSEGKLQPVPSAGGQQLVTLALLAGLNDTAATEAPIVMDTPLGRLDSGNRKRVIEWIAKLAVSRRQQAVLLVHSGEVGEDDLQKWNVTPGRSYQITETGVYQAVLTKRS